MKPVFFAVLFLFAAFPAFAISDAELGQACWQAGVKKVLDQAAAYHGCVVDAENIKVTAVDNRWWNPSKYLWFSVPAKYAPYGSITKLVQYFDGSCT